MRATVRRIQNDPQLRHNWHILCAMLILSALIVGYWDHTQRQDAIKHADASAELPSP